VWMGGTVVLENCIDVRKQRLDHGMHLITQPVHVLPRSNSAMKVNNWTNRIPRYCYLNHHRTSPVFHFWNQAFRIVGFLGCTPNVKSSWCREQHEGRTIGPHHAFSVIWCPGFMVVTPSFKHLKFTFSN
jgi:hypothetical protein